MENNPQHPETAPKRKKLALGKGLGALIPEAEAGPEPRENYLFCDIGLIRPNRFQPRRQFTDEELEELTRVDPGAGDPPAPGRAQERPGLRADRR